MIFIRWLMSVQSIFKICLGFLVCGILIPNANALKIEINRAQVQPDPIAIVDFFSSVFKKGISSEICDIIRNDLASSGLFSIVDKAYFAQSEESLKESGPKLKAWADRKARFLVYGAVDGNVIEYALLDILAGKTIIKNRIEINKTNKRETAHKIADSIYERITNEEGYFNTKLIYVMTASHKKGANRTTKLIRIDQDGENAVPLTNGDNLVLSPRYSPNSRTLAYISYNHLGKGALKNSAQVHIMREDGSGIKQLLSDHILKQLVKKNNGNPVTMSYAPRFSSDGLYAVLAIIIKGSSAIYKYDMTTHQLMQLTSHGDKTIDTTPCFSPDGKTIVYTSDRSGSERLYCMNADGTGQRQISTLGGTYSQPCWSPRGDLIVFTKRVNKKFFIGVCKPDGTDERLIASSYLVESPVFCSNGRYVIYTLRSSPAAKSKLVFTDITGRFHREIKTLGDAASPAWSS